MRFKIALATTASAFLLSACGDSAGMESERLDNMNLTPEQREVAQAFVIGMKKDTGMPMLRGRDYGFAGCYAERVQMPVNLKRAHIAYLSDYAAADKDYYAFFARMNVGEEAAWDLFQRYEVAEQQCSAGAMVKQLLD